MTVVCFILASFLLVGRLQFQTQPNGSSLTFMHRWHSFVTLSGINKAVPIKNSIVFCYHHVLLHFYTINSKFFSQTNLLVNRVRCFFFTPVIFTRRIISYLRHAYKTHCLSPGTFSFFSLNRRLFAENGKVNWFIFPQFRLTSRRLCTRKQILLWNSCRQFVWSNFFFRNPARQASERPQSVQLKVCKRKRSRD